MGRVARIVKEHSAFCGIETPDILIEPGRSIVARRGLRSTQSAR